MSLYAYLRSESDDDYARLLLTVQEEGADGAFLARDEPTDLIACETTPDQLDDLRDFLEIRFGQEVITS